MKKIAKNKLKAETIKILPVGVAKTSEILKNQQQNRLTEKSSCLIYLKGKKRADLSNIIKSSWATYNYNMKVNKL